MMMVVLLSPESRNCCASREGSLLGEIGGVAVGDSGGDSGGDGNGGIIAGVDSDARGGL